MEFLTLSRRRSSSRNVPSGEERGETDVFAGYISYDYCFFGQCHATHWKYLSKLLLLLLLLLSAFRIYECCLFPCFPPYSSPYFPVTFSLRLPLHVMRDRLKKRKGSGRRRKVRKGKGNWRKRVTEIRLPSPFLDPDPLPPSTPSTQATTTRQFARVFGYTVYWGI